MKTVPVNVLQAYQQNSFNISYYGTRGSIFKNGNLSNTTEKKQATVAISELAIVKLNLNNIHSEQERAKSIRRLLVIYLLFLQSHAVVKGS